MVDYESQYRGVFARLEAPLGEPHAVSPAEIAAAEARLGVTLPAALRRYFAVAGNEIRLNRAHNRLRSLSELELKGGKIVFLEESQAVVVWAIDVSEGDDPEVFQGPPDGKEWHSEGSPLSVFLQVMLHWQAAVGDAFECSGSAKVPSRLQLTLDEMCVSAGEVSGLRGYSLNGVVLCLVPWDQGSRLFVAGPDERRVASSLEKVGCDWERDFDQS